jgi:hypothetical protein
MLMSLKLKFGFPNGLCCRDRGTLVISRPNPNGRGGGCMAANGDENSMLAKDDNVFGEAN